MTWSSDFKGEKWPTTLFKDTHVGKAIPFSICLFLVKTFLTSFSISESPKAQRSAILAPATHFWITFSKTTIYNLGTVGYFTSLLIFVNYSWGGQGFFLLFFIRIYVFESVILFVFRHDKKILIFFIISNI